MEKIGLYALENLDIYDKYSTFARIRKYRTGEVDFALFTDVDVDDEEDEGEEEPEVGPDGPEVEEVAHVFPCGEVVWADYLCKENNQNSQFLEVKEQALAALKKLRPEYRAPLRTGPRLARRK